MSRLVHVGPWDIPEGRRRPRQLRALFPGIHIDLGTSFGRRQPVVTSSPSASRARCARRLRGPRAAPPRRLAAGTFAAHRAGRARSTHDRGLRFSASSAPTFLLGIALQFVFALKLGVLPLDGYGQTFGDHVRCLILPALTLGVFGAAYYTRLVRDEMAHLLAQDYADGAGEGVRGAARVFLHGLRNALVPLVTAVGLDFGALMGGAIVTETTSAGPAWGAQRAGRSSTATGR